MKLSYLLRHSDVPDEQGWIPLAKLVQDYGYTEQSLKQIVANDEKHRYEFSDDGKKVRAVYGHSNHVHIKWEEAIPMGHNLAIIIIKSFKVCIIYGNTSEENGGMVA